jgi:predicted RNase H-like HicB family nuclease
MKTAIRAAVLQKAGSDIFVGFLPDYPAVCAQADSLDNLKIKLVKFKDLYFDYCKKSEIEIISDNMITV